MPSYVELTLDQSANFSSTLTITDVYGSPLNLALYDVAGKMSKSFYSSNTIALTCDAAVPNTGNLTISLTPEETANLSPGEAYVFDVTITHTITTEKLKILAGVIRVVPGIS